MSDCINQNLDMDEDMYSDLFKDVYGFRPRADLQTYREMSPADRNKQWNFLVAKLAVQELENAVAQQAAVIAFEERVTATLKLGAKDRHQAIRWIYAAECSSSFGRFHDWNYLCYVFNLPHGYFNKEQ